MSPPARTFQESEFKGPVPCPNCGSTKFIEEPFLEIFVHQIDKNVQLQKRKAELHCRVCGCQVNLKGEKVGF